MSLSDVRMLLWVRALRAFSDGYISLLLPFYLLTLGFDTLQVGAIATGTLLGSGALTLLVGLIAHRFKRRRLLVMAAGLMIMTGAGFTFITDFLPMEHTLLSQAADDRNRTALFAKYSLIGSLVSALGALAAGLPGMLANTG